MNKYQESLEIVDELAQESLNSSRYLRLHYNALKELVEKAKPKKPDKYVLLERDSLGFPTHGYCKTCGTSLLVKNNYCGRCGQAIDWSE